MNRPTPGSPAFLDALLAAVGALGDDESLHDDATEAEIVAFAADYERATGKDPRPRLAWMREGPLSDEDAEDAARAGVWAFVFEKLPAAVRALFTLAEWAEAAPWVARDDPEGYARCVEGGGWSPRLRAGAGRLRLLGEEVRAAFAAFGQPCELRPLVFAGEPGEEEERRAEEELTQSFEAVDGGHLLVFGLYRGADGTLCASVVDSDLAFPDGRLYQVTVRLAQGVGATSELSLRGGFAAAVLPFPAGVQVWDVQEVTWRVRGQP